VVLVTDTEKKFYRPGDCAGFKAGVKDGHHLQNRSGRDAILLEVGSRRVAEDEGEYPDIDMRFLKNDAGFTHPMGRRIRRNSRCHAAANRRRCSCSARKPSLRTQAAGTRLGRTIEPTHTCHIGAVRSALVRLAPVRSTLISCASCNWAPVRSAPRQVRAAEVRRNN